MIVASAAQTFLHHVPKPISFVEFYEALQATCPPRFPDALQLNPRRVVLAVSGGVDSMALAFLFNRLRAMEPAKRIADNSILIKPLALVVDHRLRPGSGTEAEAVVRQINRFKFLNGELLAINWRAELSRPDPSAAPHGVSPTSAAAALAHGLGPDSLDFDPAALPNVESLARRIRYRKMGRSCRHNDAVSLFTAHHEDDQYETVLMRLLAGHGPRGLRGIQPASNIPECHDMHTVYESGFVDDQLRPQPFINFRPKRRDWRFVRRELTSELDVPLHMSELREGSQTDLDAAYIDHEYGRGAGGGSEGAAASNSTSSSSRSRRRTPPIPPIPTEDAGVMVYRPLLGFSKDRLRATCEANSVDWFEDHTNKDPTLTMRNAVRHLWQNHQLPKALQKPAILQLSRNCVRKTRSLDREADQWLFSGMVTHSFDPNIGSLVVQLPDLAAPKPRRKSRYNRRRRELRHAHRRTIAALIVRRLAAFVTPEKNYPPMASLNSCVTRLFPSIALPSDLARLESAPKPFNHGSVLFTPLQSSTAAPVLPSTATSPSPSRPRSSCQRWLITREPYPSFQPLPTVSFVTKNWRPEAFHYLDDPSLPPHSTHFFPWRRWELFDGRFWVRLRARFKGVLRVAPFTPAHAREFREGLDDAGRAALADVLRRHAPGKVRYTLPALYSIETPPPPAHLMSEEAQASARQDDEDNDDGPSLWSSSSSPSSYWDHNQDPNAYRKDDRDHDPAEGQLENETSPSSTSTSTTFSAIPTSSHAPSKAADQVQELGTWRGQRNRVKLLALLTVPVHLPGVDKWVQWELRYRKVDTELLERTFPVKGLSSSSSTPQLRFVNRGNSAIMSILRGNKRKRRRVRI